MEVELRHLRSVVAVAEEGHFARAAERLHISQPALSRQIRALETELGVELFNRGNRPIRLTPAGETFLHEGRSALEQVRRAVDGSRRARRGEVGRLSIGAINWAHATIVPALLRACHIRAPDVSLELTTSWPTGQAEDLLKERVDVAFAAFAPWSLATPALQVEPLLDEPMMAVLPPEHPLAERSEVSLEELATEPFISLSNAVTPGLITTQLTAFQDRGLTPASVREVEDPPTLFSLVASGAGVSVHMAAFGRLLRDLSFVPLAGDPLRATLLMAWRRDDDREHLRVFLQTAREVARSLDPA